MSASSSPGTSPLASLLSANVEWAEHISTNDPDFFGHCAKGQSPKVLWIGCADSRVPESVLTGAKPGDIFVHRNIANQFHPDDDSALSVLAYAVNMLGVEHALLNPRSVNQSVISYLQSLEFIPTYPMQISIAPGIPRSKYTSPYLHTHHKNTSVVIAGHTHCGGAAACLQAAQAETKSAPDTPLGRWLAPLTKLVTTLDLASTPEEDRLDAVVVANVKQQVENVCESDVIKAVWAAYNTAGEKDTEKKKQVWVHGWVYDVGSGRIQDLGVSRGPTGSSG
ncbi:hypothetical protein ID866_10776 [Astraeus odoratus]|nr:hypothetical protein ID866_10776 [Astraeus odoratus]